MSESLCLQLLRTCRLERYQPGYERGLLGQEVSLIACDAGAMLYTIAWLAGHQNIGTLRSQVELFGVCAIASFVSNPSDW